MFELICEEEQKLFQERNTLIINDRSALKTENRNPPLVHGEAKENIESDYFLPGIIFHALDRKLKICFVASKREIQFLTYYMEKR